nr:putative late blight resistance protein homolog R1B-14 [Ipomoea batatas]
MDFAVVTSILGIVDQHLLQQPHPSLILPADTQIIPSLRKKLCFLQSYLQESEPKTEPEAQKLLHEGIRDVAAEAEEKIESKLSDVYLAADKGDRTAVEAACEDLHHTLQQVGEDIESVEVRIRDYLQVRPTASIDDAALSTPSLQLADIHSRDGYGLSKSYLGHEGCIVSLTSEISEADTQCLADRLGNILKGQRYFIVINDIRTTEVWDCLQKYLPDDSKGNRILITTRILDVALHSSRLLRVLDLSLIKCWNGVPNEVVNLIHLRYLALTTSGSLYNFQLFKLQNLQTLILFSWMEECRLQLPCDILDLPWLRHVHLDKGSSLYLPKSIQGNLQTLFWLKVACWDAKTAPDFTRVPNLKELGIYVEGEMPDALDSLTQLYQLESLKFELGRVERFCLPISFPPNIKKLTLRNTYLPWEEMDIIAKLRNLEVLKLKDFAFCGPEWEPRNVFCRLKFLLIEHLDLKLWNASANCFPVLECLVLRYCWYLKKLPSDISDIHTLQLIQLINCYPPLVESAQRIKRKQMVNGILDGVVVEYFSSEFSYDKLAKDVNFEEDIDEIFPIEIPKETDGENSEKSKEKINKNFKLEIPKLFGIEIGGNSQENFGFKGEKSKEICKETDGEKGEKSKEKTNKTSKAESPKGIGKEMGENYEEIFPFKIPRGKDNNCLSLLVAVYLQNHQLEVLSSPSKILGLGTPAWGNSQHLHSSI